MRLIDLDDHIYCGEDGNYERYNIDPNIPTIDAVPVVRCKNCECWYPEEDDEYGHCRKHDLWASGNWYCADGERRENETND